MQKNSVLYKADFKRLIIAILVVFSAFGGVYAKIQYNKEYWHGNDLPKGPYLTWDVDLNTTILVNWETVEACDSIVKYGTDPDSLTFTESNLTSSEFHIVRLTGLNPNTRYYYQVSSSNLNALDTSQKAISSFQTSPNEFTPFNFLVYGDQQIGQENFWSRQDWVVEEMLKEDLDQTRFVVSVGDQFNYGTADLGEIQRWFTMSYDLGRQLPVMAALGNHDESTGDKSAYANYFRHAFEGGSDQYQYVFTYADCYFIHLDVHRFGSEVTLEKLTWLESKLQEGQNYNRIFVYFHIPVFTSSINGNEPEMVPALPNLFSEYNVTAVFNGHDHFYEHIEDDGVHYFVSGGGGAFLNAVVSPNENSDNIGRRYHYLRVALDTDTTKISAISVQGQLMEEFTIPLEV